MKLLKRKKTVLLTLVLCISFLLLFSQVAFAADGVKLKASSAAGLSDEEVTITISIENAEGTEGGQFDLKFDPDYVFPVKVNEGSFVSDASESNFMTNLAALESDDDTLKVIWVTPFGDTDDSGVVCTIEFELLDEGDSALVFAGVVIAPADIEVSTTHTPGMISVDDPEVAKQKAIDAADKAIADLPDCEDITLAHKAAVEEARRLVNKAKDEHGAVNADFEDLEKLECAEARIAKLEAIKAADDAIQALPAVEDLTLDDKADVVAARALVNKAKDDHGAVDADFAYLAKLQAAENRIKELEGLKPTPPTSGMDYILYAGILIMVFGLLAYVKRSRMAVK